jgi:hypothetical protein
MGRHFFVIIFFVFSTVSSFATGQAGDRIVLGNDTLQLLAAPFEKILQQRNISPNDLWGDNFDSNTACWRSYIATWKIENQKLYLVEIAPCNYFDYTDKKYPIINLEKLFPDICEHGKIFASWVNEELLIAVGQMLYYESNAFDRIYSKETGLFFREGVLEKTVDYDNSKTHLSPYSQNEILLREFIHSNIRWKEIKSEVISTTQKVYCTIFSVNENGKIDSVSVYANGQSDVLISEAIRVIKSIPQWDVLYKKGLQYTRNWTLPVRFDLEMMNKYNN